MNSKSGDDTRIGAAAPAQGPVLRGLATMEGHGAYNRYSSPQAGGGLSALPWLEQAARVVDLGTDDRPLVIADYGSSQGRNSLRPMRTAITIFRERLGPARPISVCHTDLPGNDFSALFQTLSSDPASYLNGQANVFPSAIGRSFFEMVLPPAQVTLGWSSFAAQWLSRVPALIPGHFHETRAVGAVRNAFAAQAAADWRTFLSMRSRELRPTGHLVILMPAIGATGQHGIEPLFDAANSSLADLVDQGIISSAERSRMVIPDRVRSRSELLAPFDKHGCFLELKLTHSELSQGADTLWEAYLQHGDKHRLATQRAQFFRATFAPSLASALPAMHRSMDHFFIALERALTQRLQTNPFEIPQTLATTVVARQAR